MLTAGLFFVLSAMAQAASPLSAGSFIDTFQLQSEVLPEPTEPTLTIDQNNGQELGHSLPFILSKIKISGNTIFSTDLLHALVADAEGKSLTLNQVSLLAARITSYYQSHNYLLARALIPPQTIQAGMVRIAVMEAYYGQISLDNQSQVKTGLLEETLYKLQPRMPINSATLDTTLLLLNQIPGAVVSSGLSPGKAVGAADLLVTAAPGPMVVGSISLENVGSPQTGKTMSGATISILNPLQQGDVVRVHAHGSGPLLNYQSMDYEFLLNGSGTRLGGAYADLRYRLGAPFVDLGAHGSAIVQSVWAKQPIYLRSFGEVFYDAQVFGQVKFEISQLRDHIHASQSLTDRHLDSVALSLFGSARDRAFYGGVSQWSIGLTSGRLDFDNLDAETVDALSSETQGEFAKLKVNLNRHQALSAKNSVYLDVTGQWANTNLDSSQKLSATRPGALRAYQTGVHAGDSGYAATLEFRHNMGDAWRGQWQAVGFFDSAEVVVNNKPWSPGSNSNVLQGAGLGLNFMGANQLTAKFHLVAPVGNTSNSATDTDAVSAWMSIKQGF